MDHKYAIKITTKYTNGSVMIGYFKKRALCNEFVTDKYKAEKLPTREAAEALIEYLRENMKGTRTYEVVEVLA